MSIRFRWHQQELHHKTHLFKTHVNNYQSSLQKSSFVKCYCTYHCLINGGVWCWISNYCSEASPVRPVPELLLKDTEVNAKQPVWFSGARPLQPLMYEALCEPSAAICMGCFPCSLFFCVHCNVMILSNMNRTERHCSFQTRSEISLVVVWMWMCFDMRIRIHL